jgi:hypothetical protein
MHAGSQRATTQKQESTTTQPNQQTNHKGINTFLQNPKPTTAKSRQASRNTSKFFLFAGPIAQTKASKRQWTASTLKGKHQPKKDYPDGISTCAKRTFYFLQI